MLLLLKSFRVTSLALGQSYDCPNANDVTLNDMGKWIIWIHKELWYKKSKQSLYAALMLYKSLPCLQGQSLIMCGFSGQYHN